MNPKNLSPAVPPFGGRVPCRSMNPEMEIDLPAVVAANTVSKFESRSNLRIIKVLAHSAGTSMIK
jgi:hypothetical protein